LILNCAPTKRAIALLPKKKSYRTAKTDAISKNTQQRTMDTKPADAPAAAYPSWVMLNHHGFGRDYCLPADATNTVASCLSSAGKRIHVSFRLAAPPDN
jgi:hypothetical protein